MGFPVAALLGLVPSAIKLFTGGGTTADEIASKAVEVGQAITGESQSDAIMKALQANPEMLLQFKAQLSEHTVRIYESETERFKASADLAKTDNQSEDWYVRRMRPTFGYIMAITWGTQMGAIAWTIINTPEFAAEVITAMVSLSTIWSVGLAVLGVYVYRRSGEKQAGVEPSPAGMSALSKMAHGIGAMIRKPKPAT